MFLIYNKYLFACKENTILQWNFGKIESEYLNYLFGIFILFMSEQMSTMLYFDFLQSSYQKYQMIIENAKLKQVFYISQSELHEDNVIINCTKIVIFIIFAYTHIKCLSAVIWLKYCRYGIKPHTINQSINV